MPLSPNEIIAPPGTQHRVSLPRLLDRLHRKDCMTCEEPIQTGIKVSLVLQDLGPILLASLHHPFCRDPAWEDQVVHVFDSSYTHTVTWIMDGEVFPPRPTLLLNPSLEVIPLEQSEQGVWIPVPLLSSETPMVLEKPEPETVTLDSNHQGWIRLRDIRNEITEYRFQTSEAFHSSVLRHGAMDLIITHLYDGLSQLTAPQLSRILLTKDTLSHTIDMNC